LTSLQVQGSVIVSGGSIAGITSNFNNGINRYNYVGQDHNEILAEFIKQKKSEKLSRTSSEALGVSVSYNYLVKRGYVRGTSLGRTAGEDLSYNDYRNFVNQSLTFLDSAFLEDLNNTDTLTARVDQVFDYFVASGRISNNNRSISKQHLSQLINCPNLDAMLALNNLYIAEIANSNLSNEDKQVQLSYLAIFSHSLYFWYGQEDRVSVSGRKWWKWLIIGACDAVGGLISSPILAGAVGGVASGIATDQLGDE
jgi:hypothetical protein